MTQTVYVCYINCGTDGFTVPIMVFAERQKAVDTEPSLNIMVDH